MVGSPHDSGSDDMDNEHLDGDSCEDPKDSTSGDRPTKTHVRGARLLARVKRLSCDGAKKIIVTCNTSGKETTKSSSLMESYLGYLSRRFVSISYAKWTAVPLEIKNDIYHIIEVNTSYSCLPLFICENNIFYLCIVSEIL